MPKVHCAIMLTEEECAVLQELLIGLLATGTAVIDADAKEVLEPLYTALIER